MSADAPPLPRVFGSGDAWVYFYIGQRLYEVCPDHARRILTIVALGGTSCQIRVPAPTLALQQQSVSPRVIPVVYPEVPDRCFNPLRVGPGQVWAPVGATAVHPTTMNVHSDAIGVLFAVPVTLMTESATDAVDTITVHTDQTLSFGPHRMPRSDSRIIQLYLEFGAFCQQRTFRPQFLRRHP